MAGIVKAVLSGTPILKDFMGAVVKPFICTNGVVLIQESSEIANFCFHNWSRFVHLFNKYLRDQLLVVDVGFKLLGHPGHNIRPVRKELGQSTLITVVLDHL